MTKNEALTHSWNSGETIYIIEVETYSPKNIFYVEQDGRYHLEFYYPTGNILELQISNVEYSSATMYVHTPLM